MKPRAAFLRILVIVVLAEALVMIVFALLDIHGTRAIPIDVVALTVIISPLISAWVVAPARDDLLVRMAALRQSQGRFRAVFEAQMDGVMIISPDRRIVDANAAAGTMFGCAVEEMKNRSTEIVHVDHEHYLHAGEFVREAFEKERPLRFEYEVKRKNGEIFPVEFTLSPMLNEKKESGGFVIVLRDLTDRRRLEAERKRVQDEVLRLNGELEERVRARTALVESVNKELEAFAYSVAHDLRAPLRAMDGFSQILMEDYAPKLEPECRRYLGLVRKSAQTMGRLIDDLLAFTRLSRQDMDNSPVSMEAVVRAAIASLDLPSQGRQARFQVGELAPCAGDFVLLKQVWVNLLSNALKFTRARPQALIEIDSHDEAGETVYRVKDNGVGFDMRHADKLFKVFSRLHPAQEYEGTGVGLAIVARVVERHGGRVWARAEPDRGAEFLFTLGGRKR
ncbi:MAG TPA: hypothetical protein DCZ01_06660 [Elusimicrobia bacterium]|nr:MAG: hypothetical protein A2X37_05000 [Elusimicrobia bacterium GWA2_66_18]OGR76911.1 MAG: hypothetical protein A2X40_03940 [Elusimicrobia bacterium GWC2_65_9]HAZ08191.1 hypothetical protein [Elusimicrobiota bacterium]